MTVRELIEELEEMPMELPVIAAFKEVTHIEVSDGIYYLDELVKHGYNSSAAVMLE